VSLWTAPSNTSRSATWPDADVPRTNREARTHPTMWAFITLLPCGTQNFSLWPEDDLPELLVLKLLRLIASHISKKVVKGLFLEPLQEEICARNPLLRILIEVRSVGHSIAGIVIGVPDPHDHVIAKDGHGSFIVLSTESEKERKGDSVNYAHRFGSVARPAHR